ncbi:MAG: hypothetical protein M3N23_06320 [Pseudomonadota bacterium]|nr:hypothetical protein [Pseudomonadota bacterium]
MELLIIIAGRSGIRALARMEKMPLTVAQPARLELVIVRIVCRVIITTIHPEFSHVQPIHFRTV